MDIKLAFALLTGKLINQLIKLKGGGGTAAPGLYALKIDPDLVKKLSKKIRYGSVLVSGTNGKTTTSRIISEILKNKFKVIHNRQGSNLIRGIASTFVSQTSILGRINKNFAIWEVDEATVPEAIENLSPKVIVLLNLFRDQLDRYGEVDTVRAKWQKAFSTMPASTTLIVNADDPGLSTLKSSFKGKIYYFGVEDKKINLPDVAGVLDVKHCLNCGSKLTFETILTGHLGHYFCPNCNLKRAKPGFTAKNLQFNSNLTTSIDLGFNEVTNNITYSLPGLYNVYNVLAASTLTYILKIDTTVIRNKIKSFTAAFGRFEKFKIGDKSVVVFLIKNPTGANEVLRTISKISNLNLLAILNDNIADGKDVSWIWDTNWEILEKKVKAIRTSGIRAWDLANRLKYANFKLSKNNVNNNINYSIEKSLSDMDKKDTLVILPTYTALLSVNKSLSQQSNQAPWQTQ